MLFLAICHHFLLFQGIFMGLLEYFYSFTIGTIGKETGLDDALAEWPSSGVTDVHHFNSDARREMWGRR